MNIALLQVPVFKDLIEKVFQRGVQDSEFAGLSGDNRFARSLTELFPRDHLSQSPTTWRVA